MTPEMIIALINFAIVFITKLIDFGQQIYGKAAIPSWDEIIEKNIKLQSKIDAEKVVTPPAG